MKNLLTTALCLCLVLTGFCQTQAPLTMKLPLLDKSPMDMMYYPDNYPVLKIQDKATEPLLVRVIYSRPQKNDRAIFGGLVPYGQVWRLGANEATEIELYKDVKIGGKKVPKGRYTLYAIPEKDHWTMIVNKETDTWGAFRYDAKKDVVRTDVPVETLATPVDIFSISFIKTDKGVNMQMAWDNVSATMPISAK